MNDAMARGRIRRGERHSTAKLNKADAIKIFYAEGLHKDIAKDYGVCPNTVSCIKRGKYWSWLNLVRH